MPGVGPDTTSPNQNPRSPKEVLLPLLTPHRTHAAMSTTSNWSLLKHVESEKGSEIVGKESTRAKMSLSPSKSLNSPQSQNLGNLQSLQTNKIRKSIDFIEKPVEEQVRDILATSTIPSNSSILDKMPESAESEASQIPSSSTNINVDAIENLHKTDIVGSSTDCKKDVSQEPIESEDTIALISELSNYNEETIAYCESDSLDQLFGSKSNRARKTMSGRLLDSTYSGDEESVSDLNLSLNGKNLYFEDIGENVTDSSRNMLIVRTKATKKKWFKGGTYHLGGKPKNKTKSKVKNRLAGSSEMGSKKDDDEEEDDDDDDDSTENCDVSSNASSSFSSENTHGMESEVNRKSATMFTALVEKFNEKVLRGKRVREVFPGQTKLEGFNIIGKSELDEASEQHGKLLLSLLEDHEIKEIQEEPEKETRKSETKQEFTEAMEVDMTEGCDTNIKAKEIETEGFLLPMEEFLLQENESVDDITSSRRLANKRKAECDDSASVGSNNTAITESELISSRPAKRKFLSLTIEGLIEEEKPDPTVDKVNGVINKIFIPVCFCKLKGLKSETPCRSGSSLYCQAIDTIDNRLIGCCNMVTDDMLMRPSIKIPFMAVCEFHRKQLQLHQCCPVCGHFCTQGKFFRCRKNGSSLAHTFHKECRVLCEGEYLCPHCGEVTMDQQIILQLNSSRTLNFHLRQESVKHEPRSKMTFDGARSHLISEDPAMTAPSASYTLPESGKEITSIGLPLGPDRTLLENMLVTLSNEKPMKLRYTVKSLYNTAKSGDVEKVLHMLALGFDPNHKFSEHENATALHVAAAYGQGVVVHVLIQAGVNIDICDDEEKNTPLMMAAENDQLEVIKYLIRAGAQVDAKGEDGMTCLHAAAKAGHLESVRYLLDSGKIGINVQDDGGWTPLIWASEHRHLECAQLLLERGADPLLKDNECNISLHWSAFAGSVEISELFLNEGCRLSSVNEHGDTPLHIAARQDHYECVVLFLARGASVEARNNENETPLACCPDQTSSVWLALQVNSKLKSLTSRIVKSKEIHLHKDISMGKEIHPIECVNEYDDETIPEDYLYIIENCETSPMHINNIITSLQSCECQNNCTSAQCNCSNISLKCWYDKDGHLLKEFNLLDPPMIFECNKACRCWKSCYNRVLQNRITCRLQLFRTEGKGWGVRTLRDIQQGTFICEYIGEMISDSEADTRGDDSYLFDLDNRDGETYCIDARHYGNISRFINHLCEPNVVPVKVFVDHQDLRFPRIAFFSSREIKAYEELGFDYGEKFWIIKYKFFTCSCRSPKCKYSKDTIKETLNNYNRRLQEEQDQD